MQKLNVPEVSVEAIEVNFLLRTNPESLHARRVRKVRRVRANVAGKDLS